MKIVVDSNIVFSAILNTQSNIGQLIINGSKYFQFYTVGLLKEEIEAHREKILDISGYSNQEFAESYQVIISRIAFVEEILISDRDLSKAIKLVSEIDENDILFVALTNHLKGKLWTGDKRLIAGLTKKHYNRFISTKELYDYFVAKQTIIPGKK